jgi:hypothetical protein
VYTYLRWVVLTFFREPPGPVLEQGKKNKKLILAHVLKKQELVV